MLGYARLLGRVKIERKMIIDSHVHLVTARMVEGAKKRWEKIKPGLIDRVVSGGRKFINPEFIKWLKQMTPEKFAKLWIDEMDKNKIDHACFMPIGGIGLEDLRDFISLHPDRFSGYVMAEDPAAGSSAKVFRKWLNTGLFRGMKLYPSIQGVSVADKRLFPLYEVAEETGAPVLIHFGITHAPVTDYRYTNPLDVQLPAKMFPNAKFIIAHFGAGFFREVLLLGFHAENIYVDTSGTNNWRLFTPDVPPLSQVFRRTLEVYGADKILFGTDTIMNNATGYREFVLAEQKQVLSSLKIKKQDRDLIMGGNTARLFNIVWKKG